MSLGSIFSIGVLARQRRKTHYQIRIGGEADVHALVAPGGLAHKFWDESDYKLFTGFDPERFRDTTLASLGPEGHNIFLVGFGPDRRLVGFALVSVLRWFTTDPIASTYLLYVEPEHRKSILGRMLVAAACEIAKGEGAAAIMVGSMAGVTGVQATLMNMLRRLGFAPLGGFARRVLNEHLRGR